jgi:hypothetical protein
MQVAASKTMAPPTNPKEVQQMVASKMVAQNPYAKPANHAQTTTHWQKKLDAERREFMAQKAQPAIVTKVYGTPMADA